MQNPFLIMGSGFSPTKRVDMRIRTSLAVGAAVLSAGLACSIEDNSAAVFVEVTSAAPVVVRGEKVQLSARARRMANPTDTADIRNIQYVWATSDPALATIVGDAFGGAELTGVNAGTVDVTATAVSFESATVGTFPMRVANFLEVDSVRPTSVKWGEKLRLYGVGVRNIFLAELGAPLFQDTLTFQGDPQGLGVMEFWVPPPARTDSVFVLGPGVFFTVDTITAVDTLDVYEYNDTIPALINLDAAGPYPQLPSVLFFNPALAFEEPDRTGTSGTLGYDWYRFTRADVSRPITFIMKPQSVADSTALFTVLGDSIIFSGFHTVVNPTWFMTTEGRHWCDKGVVDLDHKRPDSLIVALRRRPQYTPTRSTIDILSWYSLPQRHAITVVDSYLTTDPRIQPDRFEENDICIYADTNFFAVPTQINLNPASPPFADSLLTIDNPHEVDWYRFRITQNVATDSTTIRVRSRPFLGGGGFFDRSDIDLYIVRSATPTSFTYVGVVASPGSADSTRLLLPSGDYYLIVADFAGEATRYSMCIRVGPLGCTPPVPLVEAAATESAVRAAARGKDRARQGEAELRARSPAAPGQSPFKRP